MHPGPSSQSKPKSKRTKKKKQLPRSDTPTPPARTFTVKTKGPNWVQMQMNSENKEDVPHELLIAGLKAKQKRRQNSSYALPQMEAFLSSRAQTETTRAKFLKVEQRFDQNMIEVRKGAAPAETLDICKHELREAISWLARHGEATFGPLDTKRVICSYHNKLSQVFLEQNNYSEAYDELLLALQSDMKFLAINLFVAANGTGDLRKIYYAAVKVLELLRDENRAIVPEPVVFQAAEAVVTFAFITEMRLDDKEVSQIRELAEILPELAKSVASKVFAYHMNGEFYAEGLFGIARDADKAMSYFLKAAKLGSIESIERIADMNLSASAGKENLKMAILWYRKAFEAGSVHAGFDLITALLLEARDFTFDQWKVAVEKGMAVLTDIQIRAFRQIKDADQLSLMQFNIKLNQAFLLKCQHLQKNPRFQNAEVLIDSLYRCNDLSAAGMKEVVAAFEVLEEKCDVVEIKVHALLHLSAIYLDSTSCLYDLSHAERYLQQCVQLSEQSTMDTQDVITKTIHEFLAELYAKKEKLPSAEVDEELHARTLHHQEIAHAFHAQEIVTEAHHEDSKDEAEEDESEADFVTNYMRVTQFRLPTVSVKIKSAKPSKSLFGPARTLLKKYSILDRSDSFEDLMRGVMDLSLELARMGSNYFSLTMDFPLFERLARKLVDVLLLEHKPTKDIDVFYTETTPFYALNLVHKWHLRDAMDRFIPLVQNANFDSFNFKALSHSVLAIARCGFSQEVVRVIMPSIIQRANQLLIYEHDSKTPDELAALCYALALLDENLSRNVDEQEDDLQLNSYYLMLVTKLLRRSPKALVKREDNQYNLHLATSYYLLKYPALQSRLNRYLVHQSSKSAAVDRSRDPAEFQRQAFIKECALVADFYNPSTRQVAYRLSRFDYFYGLDGAPHDICPQRMLQQRIFNMINHTYLVIPPRVESRAIYDFLQSKVDLTLRETEQKAVEAFSQPVARVSSTPGSHALPPVNYAQLALKLKSHTSEENQAVAISFHQENRASTADEKQYEELPQQVEAVASARAHPPHTHILYVVRLNFQNPMLFTNPDLIGPYVDDSYGSMDARPRVFTYRVYLNFSHWEQHSDSIFHRFIRAYECSHLVQGRVHEIGKSIYDFYRRWMVVMIMREQSLNTFQFGLLPGTGGFVAASKPVAAAATELNAEAWPALSGEQAAQPAKNTVRTESNLYKFFSSHPLFERKTVDIIFSFLPPLATKGLKP